MLNEVKCAEPGKITYKEFVAFMKGMLLKQDSL